MRVFSGIESLISYGILKNLISYEDSIFVRNRLFEILEIEEMNYEKIEHIENLEDILDVLLDYACSKNLINDSIIEKDLFDTKLMGVLVDRPSNIIKQFNDYYSVSSKLATNYYYNLSKDSNYIREYRLSKDIKWKVSTEYGDLDISINLSKPEKDPKDIARIKHQKSTNYPKCPLCKENEGYKGRLDAQARQNLRIIPLNINDKDYFFQYSPYSYYNEHSIVFSYDHKDMIVNKDMFRTLLCFVEKFPHYFIGANADLPIVGGSILSHDHFQSGKYTFPMEIASTEKEFEIKDFSNVKVGTVKWPMSVIRLKGKDLDELAILCNKIFEKWKNYDDESNFIFSKTNGENHNTVTTVVRSKEGLFEVDLILRNNLTTGEYPFGVFHPHEELHNIKKENIGLIEVMGLAILPGRLKKEIEYLKDYILNGNNENQEIITKHKNLIDDIKKVYKPDENNIDELFEVKIGEVFLEVLKQCGVFKRNEKGQSGFYKFIESLND